MKFNVVIIILFLSVFSNNSFCNENDFVKIYISADRTGTKASGISIEQGIRTALSEIDYKNSFINAEWNKISIPK